MSLPLDFAISTLVFLFHCNSYVMSSVRKGAGRGEGEDISGKEPRRLFLQGLSFQPYSVCDQQGPGPKGSTTSPSPALSYRLCLNRHACGEYCICKPGYPSHW